MRSPKGVVRPVANRMTWRDRLERLQGVPVRLDLGRYDEEIRRVNDAEVGWRELGDDAVRSRVDGLRHRAAAGEPLIDLRADWFAAGREAARRAIGLRPVDEQILAGLALHDGAVVEMQTGEGKTLAAVLPASLEGLSGRGVHVLTFNDYLARRDAQWMKAVYERLGTPLGCIQQGMAPSTRREAYGAEVTYVTAKEAGFDFLRDQLVTDVRDGVHRPFHLAIVDEADSLLIDEARIPLVIAGETGRRSWDTRRLAAFVGTLRPGVDFDTDEHVQDVELTEAGIERVERELRCGNLHADEHYTLLTQINCALHARVLLRRDVDYLVREGRIEVIDEFTGRVVPDRQWPDGLQAALEAKEHLSGRGDGEILGSITLQHFLRRYAQLSGMTGTARDAALEFKTLYGLEVVVVPTHRPMIRVDQPDLVFTHLDAKFAAVVEEVTSAHATGRPVLVGTQTVVESEQLASRLLAAGVPCQVLNARNDEAEASVVAAAGELGMVTISTNMAGRGTDIRLGGGREADRARVVALGGLYVIGTSRHESVRVDRQLRGRAGRQGDPGESRFFVSLEDELLVRHGLAGLLPTRFVPAPQAAPVSDLIVQQRVAQAQRVVEGRTFEMRKRLFEFGAVLEEQRQDFAERRTKVLDSASRPGTWRQAEARRAQLVEGAGEEAVSEAERRVTLALMDRAWREHLARCAEIREGVHLVGFAGEDPLVRYAIDSRKAYQAMVDAVAAEVLAAIERVSATGGEIDFGSIPVKGPASTWTYLVNDPMANQLARMLTGAGGRSVATYSAMMLMPLFLLWTLLARWGHRRPRATDDRRSAS